MRKIIKKHVSPARERYEQNNPAIKVRLTKETRILLARLQETTELSIPEIIRIALTDSLKNISIPDVGAIYNNGFNDGFDKATHQYGMVFICSNCGKPVMVEGNEMKKEIAKFLIAQGWHHTSCP